MITFTVTTGFRMLQRLAPIVGCLRKMLLMTTGKMRELVDDGTPLKAGLSWEKLGI
jgi:hypothetical protein